MSVKIWLCTWNLENAYGDDDELVLLARKALDFDPDIVVFGLQESGIYCLKSTITRFGAKLGYGEATSKDRMVGMTKGTLNSQRIGVFAKNPLYVNVATVGYHKAGAEGKGGVSVVIDHLGYRIAVATAHLDSKKEEKRRAQVEKIHRKMTSLNVKANNKLTNPYDGKADDPIDYTFFMGDLNFRMDLYDWQPLSSKTKKPLIGKAKTEMFYTKDEMDEIFRGLLDPHTRADWFDRYDTLTGTNRSAAYFSNYTFPRPTREEDGTTSLPTYKRAIGKNCKALLLNQRLGVLADHTVTGLIQLFREGYPGVNYNTKRQELDMGWLDRIGYCCHKGNAMVNGFHDAWQCYSGDHCPVYMKVTLQKPVHKVGFRM
jgi:endonuclease/exonuclease/phosphatase family metal-dependent hydrolase